MRKKSSIAAIMGLLLAGSSFAVSEASPEQERAKLEERLQTNQGFINKFLLKIAQASALEKEKGMVAQYQMNLETFRKRERSIKEKLAAIQSNSAD